MHESPLFERAALAALIDAYPRSHYDLIHMSAQNGDRRYWKEGDLNGLPGEQVIGAISKGRLWLNLRNVSEADARYKALLDTVIAKPGQMLYWPLNSPHRVENHDCLNISMTVEFFSGDIHRSNIVSRANWLLRHKFGWAPRSRVTAGPSFWAKPALWAAYRKSAWIEAQKPFHKQIQFQLDRAAPEMMRETAASADGWPLFNEQQKSERDEQMAEKNEPDIVRFTVGGRGPKWARTADGALDDRAGASSWGEVLASTHHMGGGGPLVQLCRRQGLGLSHALTLKVGGRSAQGEARSAA
jgi:hypothetical protein